MLRKSFSLTVLLFNALNNILKEANLLLFSEKHPTVTGNSFVKFCQLFLDNIFLNILNGTNQGYHLI